MNYPVTIPTDQEVKVLLETIYEKYGYDFRSYSPAHIKRRVRNRMRLSGYDSIHSFQKYVTQDKALAKSLFSDLSINVTEMFRDPGFYQSLRENVIPILKTWSHLKIWHAGCSTGEEVYSMAILLKEEGLLDRTQLYATDFNQSVLQTAKEGIYPAAKMKKYAENYNHSAPKSSFSKYYHAQYNSAIMAPELRENIIWANHNLVTDSDFAETQLIFCRNVMIYFNRTLQEHVHELFFNSLCNGGILCLGQKENIRFSGYNAGYQPIDSKRKIYKKKYL